MYTCNPKEEGKSKKCGMWPWKVPKWPWFLAEVAVKPFWDLATLLALCLSSTQSISQYLKAPDLIKKKVKRTGQAQLSHLPLL
jgi:hypothetical protein